MVTSKDCIEKYGYPESQSNMKLYTLDVDIDTVPSKVYCNVDMIGPLKKALTLVRNRGLSNEIKTWDGVFCIRKKRGSRSYSLHSWGIAVDINAFENPIGAKPKISHSLVKCFEEAGFEWGGNWKVSDGMHFQLKSI